MKLHDLIQKHNWEEVRAAIVRLYPDHESELAGYQKVFQKLKTLSPAQTDIQLQIDLVYSEHAGEFHIETKSLRPGEPSTKTGSPFVLEFTPWSEWLGMELNSESLQNFSEFDIIAHCLYEMTFFGFSLEDIRKTTKAIGESGTKDTS
jgi:hypothetical protein